MSIALGEPIERTRMRCRTSAGWRVRSADTRTVAASMPSQSSSASAKRCPNLMRRSCRSGTREGVPHALARVGGPVLAATLRGAKSAAHAVQEHGSHVGSDDQRAHEIIAQAGPGAAIALARGQDPEMRRMVAAVAADRASHTWAGAMTQFLAALDPGPKHDYVRAALNEPTKPNP
jgi:hypothetical protein